MKDYLFNLIYIIKKIIYSLIFSALIVSCGTSSCSDNSSNQNEPEDPYREPDRDRDREPDRDRDRDRDDNPQRDYPEDGRQTTPPDGSPNNDPLQPPKNDGTIFVSPYNYSIELDPLSSYLNQTDIIFIIDNSKPSITLRYNLNIANLVRGFIDQYASSSTNITVISGQTYKPIRCEPSPVISRKRNHFTKGGFGIFLQPRESLAKVDCVVDNFLPLKILKNFISSEKTYDGITGYNVLRPFSYKAAVIISPSAPIGKYLKPLKEQIQTQFGKDFFSLFTISSTKPKKNKPKNIRRGKLLGGEYKNYFESGIYQAECGNTHSAVYENATQQLNGKTYGICNLSAGNFDDIIHLIRKRQSAILVIDQLEDVYFEVIKVKLDGKTAAKNSYSILLGDGAPIIQFKNSEDLDGVDRVEIIFAAAFEEGELPHQY